MNQSTRGILNKRLGTWGEGVALAFLQAKGLTLLERNYRTLDGEIDLVMRQGDYLIFVEVKTRSSASSGYPEEAVTDEKLDHLAAAAEKFLESNPQYEKDWRLDVVAVIGQPDRAKTQVEWFENVG